MANGTTIRVDNDTREVIGEYEDREGIGTKEATRRLVQHGARRTGVIEYANVPRTRGQRIARTVAIVSLLNGVLFFSMAIAFPFGWLDAAALVFWMAGALGLAADRWGPGIARAWGRGSEEPDAA